MTTITSLHGITHVNVILNLIPSVLNVTVIFYYDDPLIITIPPPITQSPSVSMHSITAQHNTPTRYPLI